MGTIETHENHNSTVSTMKHNRQESEALLKILLEELSELKAEDLITIDLAEKSSIADFMIIASGRSSRHVAAICEKLVLKLKETGNLENRIEGLKNSDWVLIDTSDIIIHVFRPEVRDFYNLEKIWVNDDMQDQNVS